jgi:glycosyltransferase involved in cell wall biosynthesis
MRVSVVICAWSERRWKLLEEAIQAACDQTRPAHEVLLVVDHNPELLERARRCFADIRVVANEERRGLSGGRNTGIRHSSGDIVAFLDDDATPRRDWLEHLVAPYRERSVAGTGGAVLPRWEDAAPKWLAPELNWIVGCTYRGLPEGEAPVRNPIGANMSFRRPLFELVGGFTHELARTSAMALVSCDETELSIRIRQVLPGTVVMHVPSAVVDHLVPAERLAARYLLKRCWGEGIAKALVSRNVGRRDALASERNYVLRTLPSAILRELRGALTGDRRGLSRAAVLVCAVTVTSVGYSRGQAAVWLRASRRTTTSLA